MPRFLACPDCSACTAGEFDTAAMHMTDEACVHHRLRLLLQHRLSDLR